MSKVGHLKLRNYPHAILCFWIVLALASLIAAYSGIGSGSLFERLTTTQPVSQDSESGKGNAILESSQSQNYQVTGYVKTTDISEHFTQIANYLIAVHQDLLSLEGVMEVNDPFVLLDPNHPLGKTVADQKLQALEQAIDEAKTQAQTQALAQGASNDQVSKILDSVVSQVQTEFDANQPSGLDLIANTGLADLLNLDADSFLIVVDLQAEDYQQVDADLRQQAENILQNLPAYFTGFTQDIQVQVTDVDLIQSSVSNRIQQEVMRGELISMPLALLIMAVIFGGIIAALLPLGAAGVIIALSLGLLLLLSYFMSTETYVVNIVSSLALGLSIDYGLLIVSRYRSELAKCKPADFCANSFLFLPRLFQKLLSTSAQLPVLPKEALRKEASNSTPISTDPRPGSQKQKSSAASLPLPSPSPSGILSPSRPYYQVKWYPHREYRHLLSQAQGPYLDALAITLKTAGKTVFFSGLVVSIAILSLTIFPLGILKSMGAGGAIAVFWALLVNLTLTPALLLLLGPCLLPKSTPKRLKVIPKILQLLQRCENGWLRVLKRFPALVLALSTTLLVVISLPFYQIQIRSSGIEVVPDNIEQVATLYQLYQDFPATETAQITIVSTQDPQSLSAWTQAVANSVSGIESISDAEELSGDAAGYTRIDLQTVYEDGLSQPVQALVKEFRQQSSDSSTFITGSAAIQLDFQTTLLQWVPYPLMIMALSTFFILLIMTRSILIPLQAIVLNSVSLLASLGFNVWFFQQGHGEALLNFQSLGALESYVVAIIVCFGFGLSMDYELFLVSRMKEVWDAHGTNQQAVLSGLRSSAGIITSAALILIVVFIGFAAGDFQPIQQVGIGLAITIALDATIVRLGLVPAIMLLLGRANWWGPRLLHR